MRVSEDARASGNVEAGARDRLFARLSSRQNDVGKSWGKRVRSNAPSPFLPLVSHQGHCRILVIGVLLVSLSFVWVEN